MTKVLLVEDNEMNRDMLSRRLTRKGYEIEMAFDGEEGVQKAKDYLPDIILMDEPASGLINAEIDEIDNSIK